MGICKNGFKNSPEDTTLYELVKYSYEFIYWGSSGFGKNVSILELFVASFVSGSKYLICPPILAPGFNGDIGISNVLDIAFLPPDLVIIPPIAS